MKKVLKSQIKKIKSKVFKKIKLTQEESNLLLNIVLEERKRLLKSGEYTDIADDFIIKNYGK